MANVKISELTAIDAVAAGDMFAVVDVSESPDATERATAQQVADFVAAGTTELVDRPALDDKVPFGDASASSVAKWVTVQRFFNALELLAGGSPSVSDKLVYGSGGVVGSFTIQGLYDLINGLANLTDPQPSDRLAVYDNSASATKDIAVETFLGVLNTLTTLATAIEGGSDKLLIWDNGAGAVRSVTPNALASGKHSIWVPAGAMTPQVTNGAAAATVELATNDVMLKVLDFDASTKEYAQFMVRMPKSWDLGDPTAFVLWTSATGTGGVTWALAAGAFSDDDAMDAAFGAETDVTDTRLADNDLHQTAESGAIDVAGTPAAGDLVAFRIARDVADGGDTKTGDARLIGVLLIYTTNARDDA